MSEDLKVIDFHTHTFISDGVLGPAELARRAFVKGYGVLGLADHVDASTLDNSLAQILLASASLSGIIGLVLLPGVELTHVPPESIASLVAAARKGGAAFVVVHGESPVEPVAPGTNLAAIEAGVDILAHPGFISPSEVELAAQKGVYLELSARGGHNLTNGLVASLARKHKAHLLINSDAHEPGDLMTPVFQKKVALGADLSESEYIQVMKKAADLARNITDRSGIRTGQ